LKLKISGEGHPFEAKKGGDEEELRRLVTVATFVTGKLIDNFADLKVRRHVPLILLVQLLWRQGRRGKMMESKLSMSWRK